MTLTPEDLATISELLDVKINSALQSELQPVKDDIRDMKHLFNSELHSIRADIGDLQHQFDSELKAIRTDIGNLQHRVTKLELHLENVTDKNIQLLAENYLPAAKRYEKASAQIDAMQADMDIMKKVIESHSDALQKLA